MNNRIGILDLLSALYRAVRRVPCFSVSRLLATGYWLLATGILSSGCSPTYVLQAGYEEAKILWSRQPIEEILQREDLDAPTREKLRLVLRVRQFAEQELGFRVDGSYSSLAQVKQPPIAHVLTAAPRTRLEPYT